MKLLIIVCIVGLILPARIISPPAFPSTIGDHNSVDLDTTDQDDDCANMVGMNDAMDNINRWSCSNVDGLLTAIHPDIFPKP